MVDGKIKYFANKFNGYPDIKIIKNKIAIINITVDKLDCIINKLIKIAGSKTYKKNGRKEFSFSL